MAFLLAILGSHLSQYARHKAWLEKNFTAYFLTACLELPCNTMRKELFTLLDVGCRHHKIGYPKLWPTDVQMFEEVFERCEIFKDCLQAARWIRGCDASGRMLFWRLLNDWNMLNVLYDCGPSLVDMDYPASLIWKVNRGLRYARMDQLVFVNS